MENTNSQNQNSKEQSNKNTQQGRKQDENIITLLQPHDMSKTVESALHVFQGRHEKLPDLMHDVGNIILKATRRMTTTQIVLVAGALTVGAVLIARLNSEDDYEDNYVKA